MFPRALYLVALACVFGCNKSNDVDASQNINAQCSSSSTDLAKLCPAGTALESHATASDPSACKSDSGSGGASAQTICRVEGTCAVECKITLDCKCGASLITKEEVQCLKCANCGNRTVEEGEQCDLGEDNGKGKGCDNNCKLTGGNCGNNGDLRCSQDLTQVEVCTDGLWVHKATCTSDQSCDGSTYQCKTLASYCANVGDQRCAGDYRRQRCGADHRWADDPCPGTAPKCSSIGGAVQCVAGEDDAVSANYRMNRKRFVAGGLFGYGASNTYRVQLGPASK